VLNPLFARRVAAYGIDCALSLLVLASVGAAVNYRLGLAIESPREVYLALLLNFSIPVWMYFTLADRSLRGATIGKRLLKLQTISADGRPLSAPRALLRTAIKLLPWELTHIAAFLLPGALGDFRFESWLAFGLAYLLMVSYLGIAWRTGGRKSVHDYPAATLVRRAAFKRPSRVRS
jgi:uncharacterized RDD family membrane protein YckC